MDLNQGIWLAKQQVHHVISTVSQIVHLKNSQRSVKSALVPHHVGNTFFGVYVMGHRQVTETILLATTVSTFPPVRWPWKKYGPIRRLPRKPHHTLQLKRC